MADSRPAQPPRTELQRRLAAWRKPHAKDPEGYAAKKALRELVAAALPEPKTGETDSTDEFFLRYRLGYLPADCDDLEIRDHIKAALADRPLSPLGPPVNADWTAPAKAVEWLVEGWLPAGRVALFSGEGGRGKSKLALMLALGLANRDAKHWLYGGPGLAKGGAVTFASWEDGTDDTRRRMNDWPDLHYGGNASLEDLGDRLAFMDCAEHGPAWAPAADGSGHTSTIGELTRTGAAIRAEAERRESALLILDPLAAAFACNENDRGIVRQFMASWDGWARKTGCAVLLIAHPPKTQGADYSGSTDWHGAARAVWKLGLEKRPDIEDAVATKFECIKSNYGAAPEPLMLNDWKWWKAEKWPEKPPESRSDRKARKGKATSAKPFAGEDGGGII